MPDASGRFFLQGDGKVQRLAGFGRKRAQRLCDQIFFRIFPVEPYRLMAFDMQRIRLGGDKRDAVGGGRGEHHQAVQQVIAIVPPAGDMQVKVDFGRRGFSNHDVRLKTARSVTPAKAGVHLTLLAEGRGLSMWD